MLYNLWDRRLDPELCERFGIEPGELPEIDASEAVAGGVEHRGGAALTGLPPAFPSPSAPGTISPTRSAPGVVRARAGGRLPRHGRGGGRRAWDGGRSTAARWSRPTAMPGERFFIENPGWLSGGALAWVIASLRLTGVEELDALAGRAPPGADGVTFLPALSGAMAPEWVAEARGCFYGLTAGHGPRASDPRGAGRLRLRHARRGRPAGGAGRRYRARPACWAAAPAAASGPRSAPGCSAGPSRSPPSPTARPRVRPCWRRSPRAPSPASTAPPTSWRRQTVEIEPVSGHAAPMKRPISATGACSRR